MFPQTAALKRPAPTKPACEGSCPLPPPLMMATLSLGTLEREMTGPSVERAAISSGRARGLEKELKNTPLYSSSSETPGLRATSPLRASRTRCCKWEERRRKGQDGLPEGRLRADSATGEANRELALGSLVMCLVVMAWEVQARKTSAGEMSTKW